MKKFRDLSYMQLPDKSYLWVSCDSAGGIGEKKEDLFFCPSDILGYFTARVALLELMCVGATPILGVDALSVEMEPTGKKIIKGIQNCFREYGVEIPLTGSTEENFPVVQTAMGFTLLGTSLTMPKAISNGFCFALGVPMVGEDVLKHPKLVADLNLVRTLLQDERIKGAIPVGSKGAQHEVIELLGEEKEREFLCDKDFLVQSGGPSTSVLFLGEKDIYQELKGKKYPVRGICTKK